MQIINLDFCTAPDYKPRIMKLFETIGDKRTLHISWQVSHVLIKMKFNLSTSAQNKTIASWLIVEFPLTAGTRSRDVPTS